MHSQPCSISRPAPHPPQPRALATLPARCVAIALLLAVAVLPAARAAGAPLGDEQILAIYIQANGFDIEAGLLGKSQGRAPEVRALAAHVVSDHLGVRQGAYDLAAACKVRVVLPEDRESAAIEHGKVMTKLLALSGSKFDKAYLQYAVASHQAAIDAVRSLLTPAARCADLAAHLRAVLPAFEHHLAETRRVAAVVAGR